MATVAQKMDMRKERFDPRLSLRERLLASSRYLVNFPTEKKLMPGCEKEYLSSGRKVSAEVMDRVVALAPQ
jgi:hypothetical protein